MSTIADLTSSQFDAVHKIILDLRVQLAEAQATIAAQDALIADLQSVLRDLADEPEDMACLHNEALADAAARNQARIDEAVQQSRVAALGDFRDHLRTRHAADLGSGAFVMSELDDWWASATEEGRG